MSFNHIYAVIRSVFTDKRGAAMVEYALLAGLIAVVAITALTSIGTSVTSTFETISTKL